MSEKLTVALGERSYDIIIERGCAKKADEYLDLKRNVLVVTDTGVPEMYARAVADRCRGSVIVTVSEGEGSKSIAQFERLLSEMLECGFSRRDCVVAVGGGVVGDLSGFAASAYMRGIDFYNIPTTALSQIDSSVGGKTAVNLRGIKNVVGAFYQPRRVLIDADTLSTLPRRQLASGLCEGLKMAATFDEELLSRLTSARAGCAACSTSVTRSVTASRRRRSCTVSITANVWRSACCRCARRACANGSCAYMKSSVCRRGTTLTPTA